MKWIVIKGVRYPYSVVSAFLSIDDPDKPCIKIRIRNKYHIIPFDSFTEMARQTVYLIDNYPEFVYIGRWWVSKKVVTSWIPKGAGRGRIGLGHILYPVLWIGRRDAN